MLKIDRVDSISYDESGMTVKSGGNEVFLSWKVIDDLAAASEPYYFGQVVKEMAVMNSQKTIN